MTQRGDSQSGNAAQGSANTPVEQTIELRVLRQDALERPTTKRWETFAVPYDAVSTLADALHAVQRSPITTNKRRTAPIAFEYECQQGICGACSVLVNGRVQRACTAKVGELSPRGKALSVAPLTKFPLIRDLVVDRSRLDSDLRSVATALDEAALHGREPEPQAPEAQQAVYNLSRCTGCAACLEACPEYGPHSDFVGAAVLAEVERRERAPLPENGRVQRLEVAMAPGGIDDCGKSGNCVVVCPAGIPLTESLGRLSRTATRRWLARWTQG